MASGYFECTTFYLLVVLAEINLFYCLELSGSIVLVVG